MSNTFNEGIDVRIRLKDAQQFKSEATSTAGSIEKIGKAGQHTKKDLAGASKASETSRTSFRKLGAAAIIAGAGLLSIASAKSAIDTTVGLASTTLLLSKNLGLTNREASAWAGLAKVHGIATRTLWMSFSTLSRTLNAATGGTTKATAAGRAHLAVEKERLATATKAIAAFKAEQIMRLAAVRGNKAATASLRAHGVEQLAQLRAQAKTIGAGVRLGGTQIAALGGNKAAIASLKELGITQADLTRGSTDYHFILHKVLDRLDAMPPGYRKTALAQKLFGRGAAELLKVMAEGPHAISENIKMAQKYGVTLSGTPLQQVRQFRHMQLELTYAQLGWQMTFATKVMPALMKMITLFTHGTLWLRKHSTAAHYGALVLGTLAGALLIGKAAMSLWNSGLTKGVTALIKWVSWSKITAVATKAQAAAQWLLNIAMDANPVMIVILALVALGVIFFVLWKKSTTFRHIVTGAFHAVRDAALFVWNWIKGHWPLLLAILTGPFGLAVYFVIKHWDAIVGFVKKLPGRIGKAAAGMWDGVKDAFRHAVNWILKKWNHLHFGMKAKKIAGVTIIPGFDLHAPQIPLLAQGGRIYPGGSAIVGEAGPEIAHMSGNRVEVTPLGGAQPGGSDLLSVLHALANRPVQLIVDGKLLAEATARGSSSITARR